MRLSYTFVVLSVRDHIGGGGRLLRGAASSSTAPAGGGRGGAGAPVPVTVGTVVQKPMPIEVKVIGTAEPYSTVAVRAQITGELISVNFKEGDDVKKGQVLFELDRRPLEAALQQAQANLARDTAQAANAEAQAQRYQDLAERGIATKEQVDTSRTGAAALDCDRRGRSGRRRERAGAAAVRDDHRADLRPNRRADGARRQPGARQRHDAARRHQPGNADLRIVRDPRSAAAGAEALHGAGLAARRSQPARRGPATSIGRITFVDNAVDPTTGTIKIKATFSNGDRRLWPGQFVNVSVTLATDTAASSCPHRRCRRPAGSIRVRRQAGPDGRVARRSTVARSSATETVIKNGLQAGETVVTDGQLRLVPGSHISVKGDETQKVTP